MTNLKPLALSFVAGALLALGTTHVSAASAVRVLLVPVMVSR